VAGVAVVGGVTVTAVVFVEVAGVVTVTAVAGVAV